jgi:hypothetical protein
MDIRFTDWDAPVEIALPSDADIGLSRPDDDNLGRAGDIDLVWPAPTEIPQGGPVGRPHRTQGPGDFTEILVDYTAVKLNTSLTGTAIDDIVASLTPTDVETIVTAAG